jgi:hypothetical protein
MCCIEDLLTDSYMYKSENLSLTYFAPSPFPSPQWGEEGGEGKFQISLVRFQVLLLLYDLILLSRLAGEGFTVFTVIML